MGLMVARIDGSAIGYREVILRNLFRLIEFLPAFYLVALVSVASSDRKQRVGDRVAGTMVVRT